MTELRSSRGFGRPRRAAALLLRTRVLRGQALLLRRPSHEVIARAHDSVQRARAHVPLRPVTTSVSQDADVHAVSGPRAIRLPDMRAAGVGIVLVLSLLPSG